MKIADLSEVKYVNHMVPLNVYYRTEGNDNWYSDGAFTLTGKYNINGASVDINKTTGALIKWMATLLSVAGPVIS